MRRRVSRAIVALVFVSTSLVLTAPPAHALFHLMKIREIFAGTAEQPAAQYIELQMYSGNQTFVAGHDVAVFNGNGDEVGSFAFTQPVENGDDDAYILIATPEAQTLFGVTADLDMTPVIPAAAGKVCFADDVDCASWGDYKADREGTGTPFNSPAGLLPGQSMERKISGGSEPDSLDAEDDTDDSAADFQFASTSPTNNAGESPSGGGGGDEQPTEHARSVSLALRKHLVAKGKVTAEDGTESCTGAVAVKVQRRARGKWRSAGSATTDDNGAYKLKVKDRPGKYRALAPKVTTDTDRCLKARSSSQTHRH